MSTEPEQVRLLREILKWIRFTGMKDVKSALGSTLDTDQKKTVYQMSDGKRGSVEVARIAGVSDFTVRSWWKKWVKTGIVESLKAGRGDRSKHSFNLEDFGIEVPEIGTAKVPEEPSQQETLPLQNESERAGDVENE